MSNVTFESLFQRAVCQAALNEINSIDWHPPEPDYSERHLAQVRAVLKKHRSRQLWNEVAAFTRRAAAVILIVFSITFACAMGIEAVRERIIEIVTEWFDKFATVAFVGDDLPVAAIDLEPLPYIVLPGYMQEGYELVELSVDDVEVNALYENEEGSHIIFNMKRTVAGEYWGIDSEYHLREPINIKSGVAAGNGTITIPASDIRNDVELVWSDESFTYHIFGETSVETIIKIAEGLQIVE